MGTKAQDWGPWGASWGCRMQRGDGGCGMWVQAGGAGYRCRVRDADQGTELGSRAAGWGCSTQPGAVGSGVVMAQGCAMAQGCVYGTWAGVQCPPTSPTPPLPAHSARSFPGPSLASCQGVSMGNPVPIPVPAAQSLPCPMPAALGDPTPAPGRGMATRHRCGCTSLRCHTDSTTAQHGTHFGTWARSAPQPQAGGAPHCPPIATSAVTGGHVLLGDIWGHLGTPCAPPTLHPQCPQRPLDAAPPK